MHNIDTMFNTHKQPYAPPCVLSTVSVLLEEQLMASIVEAFNDGGIYTTPLLIEEKDFDISEDFNFKWE